MSFNDARAIVIEGTSCKNRSSFSEVFISDVLQPIILAKSHASDRAVPGGWTTSEFNEWPL